jgi:hypothetical protein
MNRVNVTLERSMLVLNPQEVAAAVLTAVKRSEGADKFNTSTRVEILPDGGAQVYTDTIVKPTQDAQRAPGTMSAVVGETMTAEKSEE